MGRRRRDKTAAEILRQLGTPLLVHQPNYSMLNRWIHDGLLDVLDKQGVGHRVLSSGRGQLTGSIGRS